MGSPTNCIRLNISAALLLNFHVTRLHRAPRTLLPAASYQLRHYVRIHQPERSFQMMWLRSGVPDRMHSQEAGSKYTLKMSKIIVKGAE